MKCLRSQLCYYVKFSMFFLILTQTSCNSGKFLRFGSKWNDQSLALKQSSQQKETESDNPLLEDKPGAKEQENFTDQNLDLASARIADHWFTYKVIKGDTLDRISRHFRITVQSLRKTNKIKGHRIYVGQHLLIPSVSKDLSYSSDLALASIWDYELAAQLAKESYQYGSKRHSTGRCLKGVRIALTRSMQKLGLLPSRSRLYMGRSAHLFKSWAINNVEQLCSKYKLVPIIGESSRPSFPGLIYVYHRGRCGFSKRYGHVETVVAANPTMVCSDNCRIIKDQSCKPDLILAPCKYCPDSGLSIN